MDNSITRATTHRLRRATVLVACIAVVLTMTGVGSAVAATRSAVRSADSQWVSFAGTVFASESNQNVDIAGTLHIVTRLSGSEGSGWTLDWHADLHITSGAGQTTVERYRANGTHRGTVLLPPGPPTQPVSFEQSFSLQSRAHPPSPCILRVDMVLDDDGQVASIEVAVDDGSFGGPVD